MSVRKITIVELIDYLTREHLEREGGYEHAYRWVEGHLVIAGTEEATPHKPWIRVLTMDEIYCWLDEANRQLQDDCDGDVRMALAHAATK